MPTEDELDPDDELAAEALVAGEPFLEEDLDEEELAAAG